MADNRNQPPQNNRNGGSGPGGPNPNNILSHSWIWILLIVIALLGSRFLFQRPTDASEMVGLNEVAQRVTAGDVSDIKVQGELVTVTLKSGDDPLHTRKEDSVARLGGDEFAILLSKVSSENEAKAVAQNILNAIAAPFNLGGFTIQITASIGVSIYSENGGIDMLIAEADQAMYKAKREGKNRISILQKEDTRPIPTDVGR